MRGYLAAGVAASMFSIWAAAPASAFSIDAGAKAGNATIIPVQLVLPPNANQGGGDRAFGGQGGGAGRPDFGGGAGGGGRANFGGGAGGGGRANFGGGPGRDRAFIPGNGGGQRGFNGGGQRGFAGRGFEGGGQRRFEGRRRGGFGLGAGIAGLAAGAVVGGALANSYGNGYYDDPGYDPEVVEAPAYAVEPGYAEAAPIGDPVAYCERRYRSYDPASGTYLGYDGLRHPCP